MSDHAELLRRARKSFKSMDGVVVVSPRLIAELANALETAPAEAWMAGARAGWEASGEGFNGEWPDEGIEWEKSAGHERLAPHNPHNN